MLPERYEYEFQSPSGPEPADNRDWWAEARCNDLAGTMSGLFFSEDLLDIARAKHLCSTCPLPQLCLDAALERREPWGVWGGQLFENGRILAHKRRRGRPPKVRPAEVVVIDGVEVLVAPAIQTA